MVRRVGLGVLLAGTLAGLLQGAPSVADGEVELWDFPRFLEGDALMAVDAIPLAGPEKASPTTGPQRVVLQYLANRVWEWREYEVTTADGEPAILVEVVRPRYGFLTEDEARILLAASYQWPGVTAEAAAPAAPPKGTPYPVTAIPEGKQALPDEEAGPKTVGQGPAEAGNLHLLQPVPEIHYELLVDETSLESTKAPGDTTRITATTTAPWNTVTFLQSTFPEQPSGVVYLGSGVLMAPDMVLTCGHNVWNPSRGGYVNSTLIVPGQDSTSNRPYGTRGANAASVPSQWREVFTGQTAYNTSVAQWDVAYLRASSCFSGPSTFLPIELSTRYNVGTALYTAGYPGTVFMVPNSSRNMYQTELRITSYAESNNAMIYAPGVVQGNSGGMLWVVSNGVRRVVGVVSTTGSAPRFTESRWGNYLRAMLDASQCSGAGGGNPPSNDNFANRAAISEPDGVVDGTTINATRENGEPRHAGVSDSPSVWYRWTAPSSGTYTFNTCQQTTWDTVLAVYTGSSVGNLSVVASNDDSCALQSSVTVNATGGTTYAIAVAGYGTTASGNFRLSWTKQAGGGGGGGGELPSRWYFAEGAAYPDLQTFILIGNSNSVEATVDVTLLTEGNQNRSFTAVVPANARRTIELNQYVSNTGVSTLLQARNGLGIAAERAMYVLSPGAPWVAAHATVGLTAPSNVWHFPEGSTANLENNNRFQTFILLANPNNSTSNVEVTYIRDSGAPIIRTYSVPANRRLTLEPGKQVQELETAFFSTIVRVTSGGSIFAERAIWWKDADWTFTNFMEGNASPGIDVPSANWYFAEGNTGTADEFIYLLNPNVSATTAQVTFLPEGGGGTQSLLVEIPGRSRRTLNVGQIYTRGGGHGTLITAGLAITAERSMFWNRGPYNYAGAHNSIGATAASRSWLLPEGASFDKLQTEILIANGNSTAASVEVRYLLEGDPAIVRNVTVPAFGRLTVFAADTPGVRGKGYSTLISSNIPVVVERSMYVDVDTPVSVFGMAGTCSLGIRVGPAVVYSETPASELEGPSVNAATTPPTPTPTPVVTPTPTIQRP